MHIRGALLFLCTGHARRFGLIHDLRLSTSEYKWAVLIFIISNVSNKNERGNNSLEATFHELKNVA